jgi:hypothetical protein
MPFVINHRIEIQLPLSKLLLATVTSAFSSALSRTGCPILRSTSSLLRHTWRSHGKVCVFGLRHFEVVTPYSLLGGPQPFGAKHCLRLQGRNGEGGRNLRTVNTVIIFRNPEQNTSYFPLWIPLFVCSFTVGLPILCPVSFSCHSLSCRVVILGEDSLSFVTTLETQKCRKSWDDNPWGLRLSAHCYIPLGYINHPKMLVGSVGYQVDVITNICLNKMFTDWWKELCEGGRPTGHLSIAFV